MVNFPDLPFYPRQKENTGFEILSYFKTDEKEDMYSSLVTKN